jgi:hypothetical protein
MIAINRLPTFAAACGLALLFGAAAQAQDAPPPPHAPGQFRGQAQGQWREHMQAARAEHARILHDALAIRPDQEAAWQAFQAATTPAPGERKAWREAHAGERGAAPHAATTPERLDRMAQRLAEHEAAFQRHAAAVKTFYAVLSPQQQRTFDALAELGHGRHGGRPGMGGEPRTGDGD